MNALSCAIIGCTFSDKEFLLRKERMIRQNTGKRVFLQEIIINLWHKNVPYVRNCLAIPDKLFMGKDNIKYISAAAAGIKQTSLHPTILPQHSSQKPSFRLHTLQVKRSFQFFTGLYLVRCVHKNRGTGNRKLYNIYSCKGRTEAKN